MGKEPGLRHTWKKSPGPAEYAAAGWVQAKPVLPKGWTVVGGVAPEAVDQAAFDAPPVLESEFDSGYRAGPAGIGINIIRYREATHAGEDAPVAAVVADLVDVGAGFVRQPEPDLKWPSHVQIPVLVPSKVGGYNIEPLREIFRTYTAPALTALFNALDSAAIEVILTVLSWGQAGGCTKFDDPLGILVRGSIPRWQWEKGHLNNALVLGSAPAVRMPFSDVEYLSGAAITLDTGPRENVDWLLDTMDIRSPYKRQYMLWMAQAACDVLHEIGEATNGAVRRRLIGIELFNEINLTCRSAMPADTCRVWAKATTSALTGVFRSYAVAGRPAPQIAFPSMGGSSAATPWGLSGTTDPMAVLYFLDRFLRALDVEVGSLDAFSRLDMHWYHFKENDDAGRPGACIVQDVRETKKTLLARGSEASVSLGEIGIPGWYGINLKKVRFDISGYPMLPSKVFRPDGDSFQAREIWRRLGVGLASGASRIGWHTHRTHPKGDSAGCGVRNDSALNVALENQRPSWAAFERVFERILGSTARSGSARLVWPTHARQGSDFALLTRTDPLQMSLVVEFYTPNEHWIYLAFIDSVAQYTPDNWIDPTLTLTPIGWTKGQSFEILSWGTLPTVAATSGAGGYPNSTFSWGSVRDPKRSMHLAPFSARLPWGGTPLLIACERRMAANVSP